MQQTKALLHFNFYAYLRLMRLDKRIGIYLLLWPTLMALWIAGNGKPDPFIVLVFILGVIVMRSTGCVINDIADREFDKFVKRTQNRPLVTGEVTLLGAFILFLGLVLIAFLLVLQLNLLTMVLSSVGLLLAIIYPFMKRYNYVPQVILGAAFGWAIPMAFVALTRNIPPVAFLLFFVSLCWAVIYDTEYAMVDRSDDIKIGIKSTAIWFGKADAIVIGVFQLLMLALLVKIGVDLDCGKFYFGAVLCAGLCFIYQQYLMKNRNETACFHAFLNNNLVGGLLFMGLYLDYW